MDIGILTVGAIGAYCQYDTGKYVISACPSGVVVSTCLNKRYNAEVNNK